VATVTTPPQWAVASLNRLVSFALFGGRQVRPRLSLCSDSTAFGGLTKKGFGMTRDLAISRLVGFFCRFLSRNSADNPWVRQAYQQALDQTGAAGSLVSAAPISPISNDGHFNPILAGHVAFASLQPTVVAPYGTGNRHTYDPWHFEVDEILSQPLFNNQLLGAQVAPADLRQANITHIRDVLTPAGRVKSFSALHPVLLSTLAFAQHNYGWLTKCRAGIDSSVFIPGSLVAFFVLTQNFVRHFIGRVVRSTNSKLWFHRMNLQLDCRSPVAPAARSQVEFSRSVRSAYRVFMDSTGTPRLYSNAVYDPALVGFKVDKGSLCLRSFGQSGRNSFLSPWSDQSRTLIQVSPSPSTTGLRRLKYQLLPSELREPVTVSNMTVSSLVLRSRTLNRSAKDRSFAEQLVYSTGLKFIDLMKIPLPRHDREWLFHLMHGKTYFGSVCGMNVCPVCLLAGTIPSNHLYLDCNPFVSQLRTSARLLFDSLVSTPSAALLFDSAWNFRLRPSSLINIAVLMLTLTFQRVAYLCFQNWSHGNRQLPFTAALVFPAAVNTFKARLRSALQLQPPHEWPNFYPTLGSPLWPP
jgi:hypothetical protein